MNHNISFNSRQTNTLKPLSFGNLHVNQWDNMFEDSFKFSFGKVGGNNVKNLDVVVRFPN